MRLNPPHLSRPAARQQGNALVLVLLSLIIVAAIAGAYFLRQRIDFEVSQGNALFDEMRAIQLAVNKAIFNSYGDLQKGTDLVIPGYDGTANVTVPVLTDPLGLGRPTWRITLADLRSAGLLPEGLMHNEKSAILDGTYVIEFYRTPINCVKAGLSGLSYATCQIDGLVVLDNPIATKNAAGENILNAFIAGAFQNKAAQDGGMSLSKDNVYVKRIADNLPASSDGHSYAQADTKKNVFPIRSGADTGLHRIPGENDAPNLPALRVGSFNFHLDDLVRMQDQRNIEFGSHFSVGGNAYIQKDVHIGGQAPILGHNGDISQEGSPCASLTKEGNLNLACQGQLSLVVAQEGQPCQTPEPVRQLKTGEPKQSAARYGALPDGALATCLLNPGASQGAPNSGHWVPLQRFRAAGSPCGSGLELEGSSATDPADHQNLICKGARYLRISALTSDMVLQDTFKVTIVLDDPDHKGLVNKPTCADAGNGHPGLPRIFVDSLEENSLGLYPKNAMVSGVERFVKDVSDTQWQIELKHSIDKNPISGTVNASIFCVYP